MLTGIAASPGIAIGKALVLTEQVQAGACADRDQQQAFREAQAVSKAEILALRRKVSLQSGEKTAAVFDAHLMMLEDPVFTDAIIQSIATGTDAVSAVAAAEQTVSAMFLAMEDEYMRERAADIHDICRRLIRHLTGAAAMDWDTIEDPVILFAHDLAPSDTAQLTPAIVQGFAVEIGGKTSHSAIIARTMGIPAVVGAAGVLLQVKTGELVILDGEAGAILLNPTPEEVNKYREKLGFYRAERQVMAELKELPAGTLDGHRVELTANVSLPRDVGPALANGAEGVGLYRTEFIFMNRDTLPSEEEQFAAYKAVVEGMHGRPVVIRTLDVGGDKQIDYLAMPKEDNPFLGWRAIRMCLDRPLLFKTQLRALWRAGCFGDLKIMFPMISNAAEVRQAKALLAEARQELVAENKPAAPAMPVGIMIEIPSAALIADQLAREVDFFSIGSNDLIQYTLSVDRMNDKIAHLYQPLHPGILNLLSMVIKAAHRQGKWVGMCGEMAGDVNCVPLLLGLGLDEFSMSAGSIPKVKQQIRKLSLAKCRQLAEQCLAAATAEDVGRQVAELTQQ
jgi:phosphotransferase system enzyme I (PtsI)